MLSSCQSFMLIIDHSFDHKVVTQKTYWPDLDQYYEMLRKMKYLIKGDGIQLDFILNQYS